jgi:hypothetical protein
MRHVPHLVADEIPRKQIDITLDTPEYVGNLTI